MPDSLHWALPDPEPTSAADSVAVDIVDAALKYRHDRRDPAYRAAGSDTLHASPSRIVNGDLAYHFLRGAEYIVTSPAASDALSTLLAVVDEHGAVDVWRAP